MKIPNNFIKQKTNLLGLIAFTLFIVGYWPVFLILAKKWLANDEYTHAFLTLPIIIYMVWTKRDALKGHPVRYSTLGLVLIAISTLAYMFALLTQVDTLIALSMLMTGVGVAVFLTGMKAVRLLFTPFLLLAMLIPVPDQSYIQATFPLQLKVSQISEMIIHWFGVPIFREGNIMTIPGKIFEVVQACSGLRSMITLLTLSVIMGYFFMSKGVSKIVLIAVSIPTAVFVNIIRVVSMILLFHFFKLDVTEGISHTLLSMIIFGIALGILIILQRVLEYCELQSK